MKVNELIEELSKLPGESEIEIFGIFDADRLEKGEDWDSEENYRQIDSKEFDVYKENKKAIIQFFEPHKEG